MKQFYPNPYYANRPASNDDKQDILKFLELEAECDKENYEMMKEMELSHLTKTKISQFNTAVNGRDGWFKTTARNIKHYKNTEPFSINNRRGWYNEAR